MKAKRQYDSGYRGTVKIYLLDPGKWEVSRRNVREKGIKVW